MTPEMLRTQASRLKELHLLDHKVVVEARVQNGGETRSVGIQRPLPHGSYADPQDNLIGQDGTDAPPGRVAGLRVR